MSETTTPQTNGATPSVALTPYQERSITLREEISQDATPRAIVPRSLAEAKAFADMIANSSLVPDALRNKAADCCMILLAGAELGIPPIKSLALFHVIEGVPKLSADGVAGIVSASELCDYLEPVEQTNERVVWRGKKRGRPELVLAWTDEDVKRAGLDRPTRSGAPSNHVKFPRAMKNARCKAELAKLLWPELVSGIVSAEEARDIQHAREIEAPAVFQPLPTPTPATSTPTTPATSRPETSPAPTKARAAKEAAKAKATPIDATPIDATSSERRDSGPPIGSPIPSGLPSTSSGLSTSSSDSPASSSGGLPPDAARDEAFRKARENASELERSRAESTFPAPADMFDMPTGEDRSTPATADDDRPPVTPDEDTFGGDEEAPSRGLPAFLADVDAAIKSKDPKSLEAVKAEWLPWSKVDGPSGGKIHALAMREAFAKARAALGIR